ncbi:PadR family transcriptional regulator [Deinococcus radiotolerans]|uniref:PadR family transcriptional regulator n=1 Tax=Deinococcus radiotolerans TaxID=1309407 RepID=A0ABQ2FRJ9_9DEIO|nr:PadR family transcriptional regulator [Deinococcus radiotolerans]GGL20036.1 PadR family transcriptional regulator [Deinococcus radiotolerans]
MNPDLMRGNLDLILLSILNERPQYGLAIIQEAKSRTDGYFNFKEGSLYPALYRLEKDGLLESEYAELGGHGKPRKYYRLTAAGQAMLARKRREYAAFHRAMGTVTGGDA